MLGLFFRRVEVAFPAKMKDVVVEESRPRDAG